MNKLDRLLEILEYAKTIQQLAIDDIDGMKKLYQRNTKFHCFIDTISEIQQVIERYKEENYVFKSSYNRIKQENQQLKDDLQAKILEIGVLKEEILDWKGMQL